MSISNRDSRVQKALDVNSNVGVNTPLLEFVVGKPIVVHRYSIISTQNTGLGGNLVLKLRLTRNIDGVIVDLPDTDLLVSSNLTRDEGVYKEVKPILVLPGDTISVALAVSPGAAGNGNIMLEYWELPLSGPDASKFIESV